MTLPLNSRLSALYNTNGTQKDFSFGFRVFFDPDNGGYGLEVRRQTADGYEVIPKSDYLVLPVEDNSAGIVRFSVAPSAGQKIYIAGKTPTIQQLVLTNFGRYSAESIETQFDFITAIIQEWLSALGEETRQRIAADTALNQYVIQRIDAFVQQVNQNWDDKSQEIEDYIAAIMPSFTQTLRDEIEAFAVAGMKDAIDQTLADSKAEIDDAVSRANAAATAAAIIGKLYDTPEAGVDPVTGVADGAYFNVRSSSDESYVDEYQNIGGVPTPSGKSYPSSQALNVVKQEQLEQKEKIGEVAVKFLRASSLGLVKWSDIDKKPPYTATEYSDAYNNGVRIANAIKAANDAGFSEVVLETGNYPVFYPNESGSTSFSTMLLSGAIFLDGVKNMTVNLGQSTLFVLYDSVNKHQYNPSPSSFAAWKLAGAIITATNCRGITFKNGRLYGDQYKRAWLSGEKETEQTYGIKCSRNNRDFRFENMKFTGFRGDGIQGMPRGHVTIASTELQTWKKGGLDTITGLPNTQVGAYRSAKITLAGAEIIDQKIQIMGWSTRKIAFRSTYIDAYFFDSASNVISIQKTQQAADITVPFNAAQVQLVAYDDERTTDTVTYALLDFGITLGSGMSYGFYVDQDCEFYENMRGGISNLGCGLKVFGARFRDSGLSSKLGFPAFSYTTQYGINLEDTYINDLYIDGVLIDNVPIPVITNTRNFTLKSSIIKNAYYGAVALFGPNFADISENTFENIGNLDRPIGSGYNGLGYTGSSNDTFAAQIKFHNNKCIYTNINFNVADNEKVILDISGNTVYRGRFIVAGNGINTKVVDNNVVEVAGKGDIHKGCYVSNAYTSGNLISGVPLSIQEDASASVHSMFEGFAAEGNAILVKSNLIIAEPFQPNRTVYLSGDYKAEITGTKPVCYIAAKAYDASTWGSSLDTIVFNGGEFSNINVVLQGTSSSRLYTKLKVSFNNYTFNNTEFTNQIRNTYAGEIPEVMFSGCTFDVSTLTALLRNTYNTPIIFNFSNCTFTSVAKRNFNFATESGIQGRFFNCSFNNVVNTGSLITVDKTASTTFDPPSLSAAGTAGDATTVDVTLSGAAIGDNVSAAFSRYNASIRLHPVVSAANTVTVEFKNTSTTAVDLLSGTLTVKLI